MNCIYGHCVLAGGQQRRKKWTWWAYECLDKRINENANGTVEDYMALRYKQAWIQHKQTLGQQAARLEKLLRIASQKKKRRRGIKTQQKGYVAGVKCQN